MNVWCVIPARYGSTRFPGKPLALIGDKPMIQWVYEKALQAKSIDRVLVATDDRRILQTVQDFGGQAVMTPSELPSGTDRVAFAVKDEAVDVVINLQGDEPFVQPELLDALADVFAQRDDVHLATPVKRITRYEELIDPNLVRVVIDKDGWALYFTRSVIPYLRDVPEQSAWPEHFPFFKHVGIYAYRKEFLLEFTGWASGALEQAERLEQLRVLENGRKIFTVQTEYESFSVDTPQDLKKINQLLTQKK